MENNEYILSNFDTRKNEVLGELGNVKYNDLKDLVYRFQLTYNEIKDILDLKYNPTERTIHSPNPGVYEVVDLNNTLKYVLPDNVKVSVTVDGVRLKSNLKINQIYKLIKFQFSLKSLSFILYQALFDHILIL